jgi:hypothetical protein
MIAPGHPFERVSDVRFIEWQAAAVEAVEALREASGLADRAEPSGR